MILRIARYNGFRNNLLYCGVILKSGLTAREQGLLFYGIDTSDLYVCSGEMRNKKLSARRIIEASDSSVFPQDHLYKYIKNRNDL